MKINVSSGIERPVLKDGLYVCKIVDMVDKPDNEYDGKLSPQISLYLQPLSKLGSDKPMEDVKGNEYAPSRVIEVDGVEKEIPRILFYNVGYFFVNGEATFSTSDKSKYYKLKQAIFGSKEAIYENLEDYMGDTLVANVIVREGKKGQRNTIESIANHEDNTIKTKTQIAKAVGAWRKMRDEIEARVSEKSDVDLGTVPF